MKLKITNIYELVQLWTQFLYRFCKRHYFYVGLIIVMAFYLLFSFHNIKAPFISVSEDNNGIYGIAAINWVNHGPINMKFGIYDKVLLNSNDASGSYYTHHPQFFILPNYVFYRLFGVSELTTRLGPLTCMLFGIIIFSFALRRIFKRDWQTLLVMFIFVIFPGVIFYGKTFEMAVFSLPAALITYSLFIFYIQDKKQYQLYLFYLSIIIGGLLGWFYLFMPASIWFYLLVSKQTKKLAKRRQLLVLMPIISVAIFAFNFLHFYILNGQSVGDLIPAFQYRAMRQSFLPWFRDRILWLLKLHATWVFVSIGAMGLISWIFDQIQSKKISILMPLLLWPLMIYAVFFTWSTHPFGVIYTLPILAVMCGYLVMSMMNKSKFYGILALIIIIFSGLFFSWKNQKVFYDEFIILYKQDINLVKIIKNVDHDELCLGRNDQGIGYIGILEWYLGKRTTGSPQCLTHEKYKDKTMHAIIFAPQLGEYYKKEAELFLKHQFKPIKCGGRWCLLERDSQAVTSTSSTIK